MYPRGRSVLRGAYGGFSHPYEVERTWEDGFDPREEQFYNPEFNSYTSGPGASMPSSLQPYNRRQRDAALPYALFVSNFNSFITEDGLRNIFSIYGNPTRIERKRDRFNKPIAFIHYTTQREADSAITALNGKPPLGLSVRYARERNEDLIDELINAMDSRLMAENYPCIPHMQRPGTTLPPPHADGGYYEPGNAQVDLMEFVCANCQYPASKKCTYCDTRYCSKPCQVQDWPSHKLICRPPPPLVEADSQPSCADTLPGHLGNYLRSVEGGMHHRLSERSGAMNSRSIAAHEAPLFGNYSAQQDMGGIVPQSRPLPFPSSNQSAPVVDASVLHEQPSQPLSALHSTGIKLLDDYCARKVTLSSVDQSSSAARATSTFRITTPQAHQHGPTEVAQERPKSSNRQNIAQGETSVLDAGIKNEVRSPQRSADARSTPPTYQPAPQRPQSQTQSVATNSRPSSKAAKNYAKAFSFEELNIAGAISLHVMVCFARSPGELYVQLKAKQGALDELSNKIVQNVVGAPALNNPKEGDPCLAFFEGLWYRAVVKKVLGNDVGIRFVDYGNTSRSSNTVECVRMMAEELSHQPFYCTRVELSGVAPTSGSEWNENVRTALKKWTEFQFFTLDYIGNGAQAPLVSLKKLDGGMDLAQFLISNNLAKSPSAQVSAPLPTASSTGAQVSKARPFSSTSAIAAPAPVPSVKFTRPAATSSTLKNDFYGTIPSILEGFVVGITVHYYVSVSYDAVNSISIGSVIKSSSHFSEVLKFDQHCLNSPYSVREGSLLSVGSLVAAFSPILEQWFRACIVESNLKANSYKVLYIDFGNEEDDITQVRPIPGGFNHPSLGAKLTLIGDIDSDVENYGIQEMAYETAHHLDLVKRNSDGSLIATLKDVTNSRSICQVKIESVSSLLAKYSIGSKIPSPALPNISIVPQDRGLLVSPTKAPARAPSTGSAQALARAPSIGPAQALARAPSTGPAQALARAPPAGPVLIPTRAPLTGSVPASARTQPAAPNPVPDPGQARVLPAGPVPVPTHAVPAAPVVVPARAPPTGQARVLPAGSVPVPTHAAPVVAPARAPPAGPVAVVKAVEQIPAPTAGGIGTSTASAVLRKIPFRIWKSGEKCQALIVTADDLESVWIQPISQTVLELSDTILEILANLCPKSDAPKEIPLIGSYVAAIFPDDGLFYRAQITSITGSNIGVLFIDYGNSATVTLDLIRPLPDQLFNSEPCCSRIVLANVKLSPSSAESTAVRDLLQRCVNQVIDLEIVSTLPDSSIECVIVCDGAVLNDQICQLLKTDEVCAPPQTISTATAPVAPATKAPDGVPELVPAEPAFPPAPPLVDNSLASTTYDDGPFYDLPMSGKFEALILGCLSPHNISLCVADDTIHQKLAELQVEMADFAQGILIGHSPEVGEICMARCHSQSSTSAAWFRAACLQVEEVDLTKSYFMCMVDHGELFFADASDIRRIPKRFVDFCPYVAQQAMLRETQHLAEVEPKLTERVAQLLPVGSKVEIEVVSLDGSTYIVDIPSVARVLRDELLI